MAKAEDNKEDDKSAKPKIEDEWDTKPMAKDTKAPAKVEENKSKDVKAPAKVEEPSKEKKAEEAKEEALKHDLAQKRAIEKEKQDKSKIKA